MEGSESTLSVSPTPPAPVPPVSGEAASFSTGFYRWLGFALLAAFILPVVGPNLRGPGTRLIFINIEGLSERDPSGGMLTIQLLYPLIAGIAVVFLAGKAANMTRAVWLLILGVLPFLLLFTSQEVRLAFSQYVEGMSRGSSPFVGGALGIIAFVGLFAGSRARSIRPASAAAAVIGAIGGGAYLISLFITSEGQDIPLIQPFKMLFDERPAGAPASLIGLMRFMGVVAIAYTALLVSASVLCLINASTTRVDAAARAAKAFRFWVWAMAVFFIGIIVAIVVAIDQSGPGAPASAIVTVMLKIFLWLCSLTLLALVGVSDVIVAAPHPAGPTNLTTPEFVNPDAVPPPAPVVPPAPPPPPPPTVPPPGGFAPPE